MSEYCDVCGEEPCECAELAQACEDEARYEDMLLWRSGALEWQERANAPGFSMWRYLRLRFGEPDRVSELACRASPLIRMVAANP